MEPWQYHIDPAAWDDTQRYRLYTAPATGRTIDLKVSRSYTASPAYPITPWYPVAGATQTNDPAADATSLISSPATLQADRFVDSLLTDRLSATEEHIGRIEYQIERRDRMHKDTLYRIDLDICGCHTDLFECDEWPPGTNNLIEKRRSQLERTLLGLEQEKRAEDVTHWRDQQMLLRDLREALLTTGSAQRRIDLLKDFQSPERIPPAPPSMEQP